MTRFEAGTYPDFSKSVGFQMNPWNHPAVPIERPLVPDRGRPQGVGSGVALACAPNTRALEAILIPVIMGTATNGMCPKNCTHQR